MESFVKISKKWKRMSEIYKLFAKDLPCVSFTNKDAEEVYLWESIGRGVFKGGVFPERRNNGTYNGYMFGKIWRDWHVTEWKSDIAKGLLFAQELYDCNRYPKWWLDKII